jgi:hypothetical protein
MYYIVINDLQFLTKVKDQLPDLQFTKKQSSHKRLRTNAEHKKRSHLFQISSQREKFRNCHSCFGDFVRQPATFSPAFVGLKSTQPWL